MERNLCAAARCLGTCFQVCECVHAEGTMHGGFNDVWASSALLCKLALCGCAATLHQLKWRTACSALIAVTHVKSTIVCSRTSQLGQMGPQHLVMREGKVCVCVVGAVACSHTLIVSPWVQCVHKEVGETAACLAKCLP